eukprot:4988072-Prymnesium_polylepis.1
MTVQGRKDQVGHKRDRQLSKRNLPPDRTTRCGIERRGTASRWPARDQGLHESSQAAAPACSYETWHGKR